MLLHVRRWSEPAALAVHGVTSYGGVFAPLAERMGLAAVDLRGHGASGREPPWDAAAHVDDLLETATALGLERCAWIGHSFGGLLVAALAARAPERVERLVLLDPALHLPPADALALSADEWRNLAFPDADAAIAERYARGTLFSTPRATLERAAREHLVPAPGGSVTWNYTRAAAVVAWSEMSRPAPPVAPVPTLLVVGDKTWLALDPMRERYRAALGDALEEVVVDAGHSLLWDAPEATTEAVARFLTRPAR